MDASKRPLKEGKEGKLSKAHAHVQNAPLKLSILQVDAPWFWSSLPNRIKYDKKL